VLVISKTSKARNMMEIAPADLARCMAVAAKVGQAQVDALGVGASPSSRTTASAKACRTCTST
jgi:diadenosine tetraphosphate (Ap4A) HIT family hydrolase